MKAQVIYREGKPAGIELFPHTNDEKAALHDLYYQTEEIGSLMDLLPTFSGTKEGYINTMVLIVE